MKIGILGTGDISHAFMKAALQQADAEVISVYHRTLSKAAAFAAQYGIANAYDQLDALLDSGVECVYIGLPNSLHYAAAVQCIQADKHVLIEKPITSNSAELQDLFRLAKAHHVYALEINRVAFLPNYSRIRQALPRLGDKLLMNISFCKRSRRYDAYLAGKKPNVFTTEFSGGALYDLGVYCLHFVCGLLGKPDAAEYHCLKLDSGVDGMGIITLTYPSCVAAVSVSKISGSPTNGICIEGEDGKITSTFPPSVLDTVIFTPAHEAPQTYCNSIGNFSACLQNILRIIREQDSDAYIRLSEESLAVAEIMEDLRRQCSIVFAADRESARRVCVHG